MWLLVLLIVIVVVVVLHGRVGDSESYTLRDIPYTAGYGGYPEWLYDRKYTPRAVKYGLYGQPDDYPGYDSGLGLTW